MVAAKSVAALRNGLTPVLCVGEPERPPPASGGGGVHHANVSRRGRRGSRAGIRRPAVVAYEPHWAIGADHPPPATTSRGLRAARGGLAAEPATAGSRVIYGGSAGPGLLTRLGPSVDGLFLGRFAHDPAALAAVLYEVPTIDGTGAPDDHRLKHVRVLLAGQPKGSQRPLDSVRHDRRTADLGVEVFQICDYPVVADLDDGERRRLRAASSAGVRLELGTRGITPDHLPS